MPPHFSSRFIATLHLAHFSGLKKNTGQNADYADRCQRFHTFKLKTFSSFFIFHEPYVFEVIDTV